MTNTDPLLSEYCTAIRSMREGRFDVQFPIEYTSQISMLGHELSALANDLEKKFTERVKLQQIAEEITSGLFVDDILNRVYGSFRLLIPYNRMGCALLSSEKMTATAIWAKSDSPNVKLKLGFSASITGSSLQQIIETGQPRIINDLEAYLAEHPTSEPTKLIVEEGLRSSLTCPLIAQGKPVGFLFFASSEKRAYQDVHKDVFLQIAGQISILVEKSHLYQQLYELNQLLIKTQKELQHQATCDVLTELNNRRAIIEHLETQIVRAKRQNKPLGVVVLDVDHFKQFNDTHGHLAGDAVLKAVASKMKECLREYDYIGRYGGEEFLVVLGDVDRETAVKAAERINQAIRDTTIDFEGQRLACTISAGLAVVENWDGLDMDKIIAAADEVLYKAKSNGRNRVEVCRI
jgi:diguanylate cyclase (GGDEF)-like protein